MSPYQKPELAWFPFVLLNVLLCDPLWFSTLVFTTKAHKGKH